MGKNFPAWGSHEQFLQTFFVRVTGELSSFQNKTLLFHHTYDGHWQLRVVLPAPQVNSVQTWSKPRFKLVGGAFKIK